MEIVIQLPRDIHKLCRTCMNFTEDPSDSFESYVIHNNELTELSKMLCNLTSLNIFPDDGLPATLCSQCIEQLKIAYTYKTQCINVAANLKKLITVTEPPDEEKAEQASLADFEVVELKSQEVKFSCQDCEEVFTSYYGFSKHMINHNFSRSLTDKFFNSRSDDLKKSSEVCYNMNNDNMIRERKLWNSNGPELEANNDFESRDLAMACDSGINVIAEKLNRNVQFRCQICMQGFKCRKDLISHICMPLKNLQEEAQETSKNKFLTKCTLCDKDFPDTSALSLHFLKHTLATENISNKNVESEYFFCETCGQTFESNLLLSTHYADQHAGQPIWTCPKCPDDFEKERDLLRHANSVHQNEEIRIESQDGNISCVLCYQNFPSKETLLVHSRAHLMKRYSCRKCSASFCTQQSYFAHLKSHPGYEFTCSTCGKHLTTKSALKSHIVGVHSIELRHTCATCGKSFATHARLKTHSLIHTSHKKYVCSYCGYSAHKVGDLQIHTRTHTSERPYKCTFAKCTMRFKTSSHLCDHVRRHLQIRKFQCSICSMGFTTNHGLKIHQMQHTGEKPHSCIVCHQKFRRKYHVKVHMKQHNPSLN